MKLRFNRWRPTVSPRQDLIIRDYLALDRTRLSNERTLLAYYSTGLTTLVSGISGFKLLDDVWLRSVGVMFIILGIGIITIGLIRFIRFRQRLGVLGEPDYSKVQP